MRARRHRKVYANGFRSESPHDRPTIACGIRPPWRRHGSGYRNIVYDEDDGDDFDANRTRQMGCFSLFFFFLSEMYLHSMDGCYFKWIVD